MLYPYILRVSTLYEGADSPKPSWLRSTYRLRPQATRRNTTPLPSMFADVGSASIEPPRRRKRVIPFYKEALNETHIRGRE